MVQAVWLKCGVAPGRPAGMLAVWCNLEAEQCTLPRTLKAAFARLDGVETENGTLSYQTKQIIGFCNIMRSEMEVDTVLPHILGFVWLAERARDIFLLRAAGV